MKLARVVTIIGFLLFAATFLPPDWRPSSGNKASALVTAVKEAGAAPSDKGIPGYLCAYVTLVLPWTSDGMRMLTHEPVDYLAYLLSGWINPVFLIAFVLLLINPRNRVAGILRIVLIFMFGACWIVFHYEHLRPRAGYFIWIAAMLLALFAGKLFPGRRAPEDIHIG
jgi:hypothetical protein